MAKSLLLALAAAALATVDAFATLRHNRNLENEAVSSTLDQCTKKDANGCLFGMMMSTQRKPSGKSLKTAWATTPAGSKNLGAGDDAYPTYIFAASQQAKDWSFDPVSALPAGYEAGTGSSDVTGVACKTPDLLNLLDPFISDNLKAVGYLVGDASKPSAFDALLSPAATTGSYNIKAFSVAYIGADGKPALRTSSRFSADAHCIPAREFFVRNVAPIGDIVMPGGGVANPAFAGEVLATVTKTLSGSSKEALDAFASAKGELVKWLADQDRHLDSVKKETAQLKQRMDACEQRRITGAELVASKSAAVPTAAEVTALKDAVTAARAKADAAKKDYDALTTLPALEAKRAQAQKIAYEAQAALDDAEADIKSMRKKKFKFKPKNPKRKEYNEQIKAIKAKLPAMENKLIQAATVLDTTEAEITKLGAQAKAAAWQHAESAWEVAKKKAGEAEMRSSKGQAEMEAYAAKQEEAYNTCLNQRVTSICALDARSIPDALSALASCKARGDATRADIAERLAGVEAAGPQDPLQKDLTDDIKESRVAWSGALSAVSKRSKAAADTCAALSKALANNFADYLVPLNGKDGYKPIDFWTVEHTAALWTTVASCGSPDVGAWVKESKWDAATRSNESLQRALLFSEPTYAEILLAKVLEKKGLKCDGSQKPVCDKEDVFCKACSA